MWIKRYAFNSEWEEFMSLGISMRSLPENVVKEIKLCVQEHLQEDWKKRYPNPLLREDVLDLLDDFCTIIYYPLPNENNNGFHIKGILDKVGKERHFVFINTAQTIEKQVFTAAHELGHIWRVDEIIINKCKIEADDEMRESIINRFAAELLIPDDIFRDAFTREKSKYINNHGGITVEDMLKVLVFLMNQFFAPFKAVVYRGEELGFWENATSNFLLGTSVLPEDLIMQAVDDIIRNNGYTRFQTATNKKWIEGLTELLEKAEHEGSVSQQKIQKLREIFDLPTTQENTELKKILNES